MFFAPALHTRTYAPADANFRRFISGYANLKVEQDDNAWTVTLDLPGISREHLDISVEAAVVTIATSEQSKRQFKAAYELPEEIDEDASSATLADGVLTLKLAKKKPVSRARKLSLA